MSDTSYEILLMQALLFLLTAEGPKDHTGSSHTVSLSVKSQALYMC